MWQGIRGHDSIAAAFRKAQERGRISGSYLFTGAPGVGKAAFAFRLARALLCESKDREPLTACGSCDACQQVDARSHPDLITVSRPADKSVIPIELFIGVKEKRMREGLCHDVALKPYRGGRKVAIIDDADFLNVEGANCLLKTLEEPPADSVILLIAANEHQQLPTIRSRCQIVRFSPLSDDDLRQLLIEQSIVESEAEAAAAAGLADGSMETALELLDTEMRQFRDAFLDRLAKDANPVETSKNVAAFVDAAGTEAAKKRSRMKLLAGFAADFYGRLMRTQLGMLSPLDDGLKQAVETALRHWPGDCEAAALCRSRSLETIEHVAANANQATMIECWFSDLSALARQP